MPEISKISIQKKRTDRYNIFFKGASGKDEYAFSVGEDTLITEGLRKGLVLDDVKINELKRKDDTNKAFNKAIHYLAQRMRSELEVRDRLAKADYDPEQIDVVIARLYKENLLNEKAFSEAFVLTKKQTAMKGPKAIERELKEKGIKEQDRLYGLSFYKEADEVEKIAKWIGKQHTKQKKQSHKLFKLKLKQQLMQKGFSSDAIQIAIEDSLEKLPEEEEYQACYLQGEKILKKKLRKYTGYDLIQQVKMSLYQKGFPIDLIERFINEEIKTSE